jgi:hypothetical protein
MTPDQLRHEEARAWLDRDQRDLRAAKLLIAGGANAEALFHCQQAVEKALKAFLTFHEKAFRKTHDLGDLSPECLAIDASLQPAVSQAEGFTQYVWQTSAAPGRPGRGLPGLGRRRRLRRRSGGLPLIGERQ